MGKRNRTPAEEYERLKKRAEGGRASDNQLKRLEEARIALGIGQDEVRTQVRKSLSSFAPPNNVENLSENEKIDHVLAYAKSRGLVNVSEYGNPSSSKRCVLFGSSHRSVNRSENGPIMNSMPEAHYQLFCVMNFLRISGVNTQLLVEGLERSKSPHDDLSLDLGGKRLLDVRTNEGQNYMVDNPSIFKQAIIQMLRDGKDVTFFSLSNYPNINGAHSPEILNDLDDVIKEIGFSTKFSEKYQPRNTELQTVKVEMVSGRWQILINGNWVYPKVLLDDSKKVIDAYNDLDRLSAARENEVLNHFKNGSPDCMPISWTGLQHLPPIRDACIANGMSVCEVVPKAEADINIHAKSIRHNAIEFHTLAHAYNELNKALN
ncbi:hypothetical protein HN512_00540 [Candidatus Peregrinibacteria bacterium]|mgnify:CR=1 FL=1|jgi:hypothetical protein|nr:hypothetical protein [Candidatus Peregrinibacteria bacterium]MBT3598312.1 hypothetical protein [Candidatus Peregrinibacteria bacterium]MBT4367038.1 hypothetical protein [Candidatus Peregrinibacteria bacterium]MBT4585720.1 hypothetical protein [Candidatus Peregrinibacteria bacterium]MBT6730526.1 hypothetical protein [Candidatus Peregrinibacteria bacterium]